MEAPLGAPPAVAKIDHDDLRAYRPHPVGWPIRRAPGRSVPRGSCDYRLGYAQAGFPRLHRWMTCSQVGKTSFDLGNLSPRYFEFLWRRGGLDLSTRMCAGAAFGLVHR
jgi:hypothetical protein